MTKPLNLNLAGKVLPSQASSRLVKSLFVGDSQFGQTSQRLMGQIQKWNVPFVGRYCGMESQSSIGVFFSAVTGSPGGNYGSASLASTRVELGQDWGDGETGKHFHHGRRFTVTGSITTNFQELGRSQLAAGGYTQTYNRDLRHYGKVAAYDRVGQGIGGGFTAFRISEIRGTTSGNSTDITLPGTGGIVLGGREIRQAGAAGLGTAGNDVGLVIRDGNGNDADRSLHILGTLLYQSPASDDFPSAGFIPFQISQASWSAHEHLNTLDVTAINAAIQMAEGFDSIFIMLGHNAETAGTWAENLETLRNLLVDRQVSEGFSTPDVVLIAPWNINSGAGQIARLRDQADVMFDLADATGDGFINLLDFYGEAQPDGELTTPRGTFTYDLDGSLVHPNDAATAELIAKDIEWHFDEANWYTPPVSGGPISRTIISQTFPKSKLL